MPLLAEGNNRKDNSVLNIQEKASDNLIIGDNVFIQSATYNYKIEVEIKHSKKLDKWVTNSFKRSTPEIFGKKLSCQKERVFYTHTQKVASQCLL